MSLEVLEIAFGTVLTSRWRRGYYMHIRVLFPVVGQ